MQHDNVNRILFGLKALVFFLCLALLVEYNGFFGSRDSIFAAVGWRF